MHLLHDGLQVHGWVLSHLLEAGMVDQSGDLVLAQLLAQEPCDLSHGGSVVLNQALAAVNVNTNNRFYKLHINDYLECFSDNQWSKYLKNQQNIIKS